MHFFIGLEQTVTDTDVFDHSWASNGYKNFNCYRDNGRQVYRQSATESSNTCNSVYYCIQQ